MCAINLAILGATGAVGREMLAVLAEHDFPLAGLRLLASPRSAGSFLPFRGQMLPVEAAEAGSFEGCDLVLGAAGAAVSRQLAPAIVMSGAVLVDNSSAFRHDPGVPLVVPEINGAAVWGHRGVVANPNCSTIIALTALWPIIREYGLRSLTAATYQAVSGAGLGGMAQLEAEAAGRPCPAPAFPHPIAGNLIPAIGPPTPAGETEEEAKMRREARKILGLPHLPVACTCVRVPVARCHSLALYIETERPVSPDQARAALSAGQGVIVDDDLPAGVYPMPIHTAGQDAVRVGRIRPDETRPCGLSLWCCGDQLRKGAATNAVQIARLLVEPRPL